MPAGGCFAPCCTAILSSRPPLTVPPSCCLIVPAGCCVASCCDAIPSSCHAALSSSRRPLTAPPSRCPSLVIPVFRNLFFGRKNVPARIPEDSFFSVFSGGIFHRNVVVERLQEFLFFCCHGNFSQEFLWDRNSCIYPGILRIPPVSGGFRRIPEDFCSRKKLLAQASKKGGSLLSKIWTKIDLFNLSPELLSICRKLRLPIYPNRTPFTCGHHERDIYGDHAFCCERGSKK